LGRNEFLLLLDELLELEPGTVKESETLENLEGWNSLAIISLMALVDEQFGMSLQPRQIAASKTVSDLMSLLGNRVSVEVPAEPEPGSDDSR
jgi:acyl carrier protein